MTTADERLVCDLCGETAGVRVYDDDGTALCPAHVPLVFANTARRNKALTAALADAETRAALLTRALYAEVRHPINVKGGTWTDDEIRFYLSAKWGLTTPRPDAGQGEG